MAAISSGKPTVSQSITAQPVIFQYNSSGGWFQWQTKQTGGFMLLILDWISAESSRCFPIYEFREK